MIRFYVGLHLLLVHLADPARRDERGQGTLEYVGMVAVAALLVVAVITAMKGADLGGWVTTQIGKVKSLIG